MDDTLASLIAANLAFVGTHFALSHPLRGGLVKAVGEKGFLGLYSLVSLATFTWIVRAFLAVGPGGMPLWNGGGDAAWIAGSLLTVVALAMVVGANSGGNPALPGVPAEAVARAEVKGALAITRHPMMMGVGVWALAHALVSPTPRTLVTAGAMAVLAVLGAHLQDRKKEALMGDAWIAWESRTRFWPKWTALGQLGGRIWAIALALWLAITWTHGWLGAPAAGVWRWVG